jgi:membrane-bound serine protease (ClpP class)
VRESVSITEKEALEKKVIDLVAPDLTALLQRVDGREVEVGEERRKIVLGTDPEVHRLEMRLKQRILDRIADPNVAYLLFMAGLLGLYFELAHPGVIFPGVAGGICLLLALAAFQVLPISSTGVLLLLFGVAMLIAELFVTSFGVLGVGGIAAFVLGSLLLFDPSDPTVMVHRPIIAATAVTVSTFMLRTQGRRATTGSEGLIGDVGVVREWVERSGKVFVHGERWNAVSESPLEIGDRVEIISVEPGMRVRVRRAAQP